MKRFFPRISRLHCPGEEQLAAYADQQLIGAERQRVESHLAACDACLAQVGFLVRQANVEADEAPDWLVKRAAQLQEEPDRTAIAGWKWASVAVGVVAIAAGMALWLRTSTPQTVPATLVASAPASSSQAGIPSVSVPPDNAVRSPSHSSVPVILFPQSGATVGRADLTFRWAPLPNAAHYQLRVSTADGDLRWEQKVVGTSATAPADAGLKKGTKYFVWVRAVFADGKTQQSEPVSFTAE